MCAGLNFIVSFYSIAKKCATMRAKLTEGSRGKTDMFALFRGFWVGNIIQEAPAELAQCEFGCRATSCPQIQWESCKNRLLAMERETAYAKAAGQAAAAGLSPQG
jgi:hypothetical protein